MIDKKEFIERYIILMICAAVIGMAVLATGDLIGILIWLTLGYLTGMAIVFIMDNT